MRRSRLQKCAVFLAAALFCQVLFYKMPSLALAEKLVKNRQEHNKHNGYRTATMSFTDVDSHHWAYTNIGSLTKKGIICGYSDRSFRPNGIVTRAEFAKIIVVEKGLTPSTSSASSFKDVPFGFWAKKYIEAAKTAGFIGGYPDGTFKPGLPITRAELSKILVVANGYGIDKTGIPLNDIRGNWAYDYVMTVKNEDIITGYPNGSFGPGRYATRAEACTIITKSQVLPELKPIVPEATKVIDSDTAGKLEAVSSDGLKLTFSSNTKKLQSLDKGDVIAVEPTEDNPYGLLRKIESTSTQDGQIILNTKQAALTDAIEQGGFDIHYELNPGDIVSTASMQKGTARIRGNLQTGTETEADYMANNEGEIEIPVKDKVLYDADGDESTTDDQARVSGTITIDPSFDYNVRIKRYRLKSLFFKNTTSEKAELILTADCQASISKKTEVFSQALPRVKVPVGPMIVWVTPILKVYVGLDGKVTTGLTTSAVQQADVTVGVRYENGKIWPLKECQNTFSYKPPEFAASCGAKVFAGPDISMMVYDIVGMHAEPDAYLRYSTDINANPWWALYCGIDATVGLKLNLLFQEKDYDKSFNVIEKTIAEAEGGFVDSEDDAEDSENEEDTEGSAGTGDDTMSASSIDDKFTYDSKLWEYSGEAYRSTTNNYLVLTRPYYNTVGRIFLKGEIKDPFTAKFKYFAGGGSGADGLVFMFYKKTDYDPDFGGGLGFNKTPHFNNNPVPGYAVEFDNYATGNNPDYYNENNHIALIEDEVSNHLISVSDSRTEDYKWHDAEIKVGESSVEVSVDGDLIFNWSGQLDRTYGGFGFAAATGSLTNWHIIDDVQMTID